MKASSDVKPITVAIAEDNAIVRKGLRSILETHPDFQVVFEANGDTQTIDAMQELKPLVLVTNNSASGLELARRLEIRSRTEKVPAIVMLLTDGMTSGDTRFALKSGAVACILADSDPEEVVHAAKQAMKGQYYLNSTLFQDLIRQLAASKLSGGIQEIDGYDTLTSRERQIFSMSVKDQSAVEIAHSLGISCRTVEVHRANLRNKLGFPSRVSFTRFLRERKRIQKADGSSS